MSNLFPGKNPISVLDYGYVRLVDYMGGDVTVSRSARVSYNADWRAGEEEGSDRKLLTYLLKNHHYSPFEAVCFTFEIKCPIFIARQWHRHWSWRFNEVSARYTELPEEFYVPDLDKIGYQDPKNRQGRILENEKAGVMHHLNHSEFIRDCCEGAFINYRQLLSQGVPRELARSVLPVATYTRFFGTTNLRSLINFIDLRDDAHAQWEIQQYGKALKSLARLVVPVVMEIKYGSE